MSNSEDPRWRLEEKIVKIGGERRYLWQAVDRAGEILDFHVTKTRDEPAALRFLKAALGDQRANRKIHFDVSIHLRKSSAQR